MLVRGATQGGACRAAGAAAAARQRTARPAARLAAVAEDAGPEDPASLALPYAKTRKAEAPLPDDTAGSATRCAGGLNAAGLADLAWAPGTTRQRSEPALAAASPSACAKASDLKVREAASIGWATARLPARQDTPLPDAAAPRGVKLTSTLSPKYTSNVARTLGKMPLRHAASLDGPSSAAQGRISRPGSQGLANAGWDHAKLSVFGAPSAGATAGGAAGKANGLGPQELGNAARAHATLASTGPAATASTGGA